MPNYKQGIFLSQQKYVIDLLSETGKLSKLVGTPIDQNHRLCAAEECPPVHKETYQRLVGKLIYLSYTKPDIAYSVGVVSQFIHNPKEVHLKAMYQILHYLKNSIGRGLLFKKDEKLNLEV